MTKLRIGLIADTHGLLRPEALEAMRGCDRIVHAGDVGTPQVLDALRECAPVDAIRGNVDRGSWAAALPDHLDLELGGCRIHVLHDLKDWAPDRDAARPQVVVAGHSHKPAMQQHGDVLHINPGSAGPRRFKLPISVGYLHVEEGRVRGELRTLFG